MNNIQSVKAYFDSYDTHNQIKSVIFGSIDDLLDVLPNKKAADYPLVYVPYYSRQLSENQADFQYETLSFMMALYEPFNKNKGKEERQIKLRKLEEIMNDMIGRLVYDFEEEIFPIKQHIDFKGNGPNVSEPLAPNNLIGWAYEFEMLIHSTIHYKAEVWQ
ncbi:MAG: hypothetical protein AAGI07_03805 [Bacteroidota bacterium]